MNGYHSAKLEELSFNFRPHITKQIDRSLLNEVIEELASHLNGYANTPEICMDLEDVEASHTAFNGKASMLSVGQIRSLLKAYLRARMTLNRFDWYTLDTDKQAFQLAEDVDSTMVCIGNPLCATCQRNKKREEEYRKTGLWI